MFPDPEAYNPMRWLDPSYPTFKEDSTVHPTITQYSQFGYGRRVCQGQEVTEADMFVGVGAVAWLFNISKENEDPDADSAYESGSEAAAAPDEQMLATEKPDISIDSGYQTPPNEKSIEECLSLSWDAGVQKLPTENVHVPGAFPIHENETGSRIKRPQTPPPSPSKPHKRGSCIDSLEFIRANSSTQEPTITSKSALSDPTLTFSPLLIAKPYPFKFSMRIRDINRAAFIRQEYEKYCQNGEFEDEKVYWKGGPAGDKTYGWGKV